MLASWDERCEAKFTKRTEKNVVANWKKLIGAATSQGGA